MDQSDTKSLKYFILITSVNTAQSMNGIDVANRMKIMELYSSMKLFEEVCTVTCKNILSGYEITLLPFSGISVLILKNLKLIFFSKYSIN